MNLGGTSFSAMNAADAGGIGASLRRRLALRLRARTGLSPALVAVAVLAVLCAAAAVVFLLVAGFVWLAAAIGALAAALAFAGGFLLLAAAAVAIGVAMRRRTAAQATLTLAAENRALLHNPTLAGSAARAVHALGFRRLAPVLALGLLAVGMGRGGRRRLVGGTTTLPSG
jgi:hypothetical protein